MARKTKQQALETRNQIIDSAIFCFSEFGVSSTSLADIAAAAGVTRGAIYWHFKNKTDLLNAIWKQSGTQLEQVEADFWKKYPADPLAVMRNMLIYLFKMTVSDPKRRALMKIIYHKCDYVSEAATCLIQQNLYLEYDEKIESLLQKCIDAGQLSPQLNKRRAAIIIRGYVNGIIENWLFMPQAFDMAAEAKGLVKTLIHMLEHDPTLCQAAAD